MNNPQGSPSEVTTVPFPTGNAVSDLYYSAKSPSANAANDLYYAAAAGSPRPAAEGLLKEEASCFRAID